jgi:hypothetical protein
LTDKHDDKATDLLIQEVDEELRQDQLNKLFKKHANHFAAAAVALILGVAGWQGWQAWEGKQRAASAQSYAEAARLARQGRSELATASLDRLAAEGSAGYRVLAEMKRAEMLAAAGDTAAAAARYRAVANSGADAIYRDLALIKACYLELDGGDAAAIDKDLAPLAQETSPWRHSAREIQALAAERRGDRARAIELFRKLADDVAAPQGIRARATEMLTAQKPGVRS